MKKTILVIEDDKSIASDLETLLTFEGYEVLCAANGADALGLLRAGLELPNLLLLDIMMPVMNGWEFREEQLRDQRLAGIPTVVMTADGQALKNARSLGAQAYLQKPFDIDRLIEAVATHAG